MQPLGRCKKAALCFSSQAVVVGIFINWSRAVLQYLRLCHAWGMVGPNPGQCQSDRFGGERRQIQSCVRECR